MMSPGQAVEFSDGHGETVSRLPVRTYRPRLDRSFGFVFASFHVARLVRED